jgi:hypothetical protein
MAVTEKKTRANNLLNLDTFALPPAMDSAAYMLGRCVDRKVIAGDLKVTRKTIWNWTQLPAFQEAIKRYNREWLSELNERKARIIELALELEEKDLADKQSKTRQAAAHEIAKQVLK